MATEAIVSYYAYVLQSSRGDFYIGHTGDLAERLRRHNSGRSRYTRARGPWHLVYSECFETRSEAAAREKELKKRHSREYLTKLVLGGI